MSRVAAIEWIVTDLDGTLVGRDLRMVEASRAALGRFAAAGGRVVIATGRSEASARPYYDELGLRGPAILYNGARTVDLGTGEVLHERTLPAHALPYLVEGLPEGLYPVAFVEGRAYAADDVPELREYARRDGLRLERACWAELALRPVTKVMLIGEPGVPPVVEGTTAVRSERTYLEFLPEGASKGGALRELAAREGVAMERVAAIGDNPNDLDMIEVAGLGVAVGDGHRVVREAADRVVAGCAQGAVAELVALALGR